MKFERLKPGEDVKFIEVAVLCLLLGLPLMWLWNWLMPDLFGLKEIGFWQAVGLNLMSGILFRSRSSGKRKSD